MIGHGLGPGGNLFEPPDPMRGKVLNRNDRAARNRNERAKTAQEGNSIIAYVPWKVGLVVRFRALLRWVFIGVD